jgi:F-box-like
MSSLDLKSFSVNEPTVFGSLSDDVLLEIFDYLDRESLQNASLVCKNWNKVIGSSIVTMKKFTLTLRDQLKETSDESESNLPFYSCRKHVKVIVDVRDFHEITPKIDLFNFSQVRNLDIQFVNSIAVGDLIKFLSKMPLMEKLTTFQVVMLWRRLSTTSNVCFRSK